VQPVIDTASKPYQGVDTTTFYGTHGDVSLSFQLEFHQPWDKFHYGETLKVRIRAITPDGIPLGGREGSWVITLALVPCMSP